jgi:hypothetical protein
MKFVRFQVLTAANMKILSSGMLHRVVSDKLTNVSEVLTASVIRAMTARRNIPKHSHLRSWNLMLGNFTKIFMF